MFTEEDLNSVNSRGLYFRVWITRTPTHFKIWTHLEQRYGKVGQQQRATCFATLLQDELNSDAARFTTRESNLSCNDSGFCRSSCERLSQKVESSSNFCNKICVSCAFYRSEFINDSRVILSNQKSSTHATCKFRERGQGPVSKKTFRARRRILKSKLVE